MLPCLKGYKIPAVRGDESATVRRCSVAFVPVSRLSYLILGGASHRNRFPRYSVLRFVLMLSW